MSWYVTKRLASVMDPGPGLDEYIDPKGHWTKDRAAAHAFDNERDAWVVCHFAQHAHPKSEPMPAFGISERKA
jgi:hypothetical protein